MILCNILAGPLLALAPTLAHAARPGAPLKLAGMLADQAPAVAERYAPWFQTRVVPIDDEWSAVSGTRKA
jgi:ribosomal protein L11 methyltransferase